MTLFLLIIIICWDVPPLAALVVITLLTCKRPKSSQEVGRGGTGGGWWWYPLIFRTVKARCSGSASPCTWWRARPRPATRPSWRGRRGTCRHTRRPSSALCQEDNEQIRNRKVFQGKHVVQSSHVLRQTMYLLYYPVHTVEWRSCDEWFQFNLIVSLYNILHNFSKLNFAPLVLTKELNFLQPYFPRENFILCFNI